MTDNSRSLVYVLPFRALDPDVKLPEETLDVFGAEQMLLFVENILNHGNIKF